MALATLDIAEQLKGDSLFSACVKFEPTLASAQLVGVKDSPEWARFEGNFYVRTTFEGLSTL